MPKAPEYMKKLAETFARKHKGLDFSLKSLPAFERILAAAEKPVSDVMRRFYGAYLGETIRRAAPSYEWQDFATAARKRDAVAKLGRDVDTGFLLVGNKSVWFPIVKVDKFLANGPADSTIAFAGVVIGSAAPIEEDAPKKPKGTLAALLPRFDGKIGVAFEAWKHFESGTAGAKDLPALKAMLTDANENVRCNAAYVLASWHFRRGKIADGVAQYSRGDGPVRVGTLKALDFLIYDRKELRDPVAFAPMLEAALAGRERSLALDVLKQMALRAKADVSAVLPALVAVLDDGKPAQVEVALDTLDHAAWNMKHNRIPFDTKMATAIPAILRHRAAKAGKVRPTKVQRAAESARDAFLAIADRFAAKDRAKLAR